MFGHMRFGRIGEFKNATTATGQKIKPAIGLAIQDVLPDAVDITREVAPVDTGYMRDHIYGIIVSQTSCKLVSEAPYSHFVNFGHFTRAGTWVEAQPFFSMGVNHFRENISRAVIEQLLIAGMKIIR